MSFFSIRFFKLSNCALIFLSLSCGPKEDYVGSRHVPFPQKSNGSLALSIAARG